MHAQTAINGTADTTPVRLLIATDMEGGKFFAGDADDRLKLYRILTRMPDVKLAYVTGRGLESILPLLDDPTIPEPDYVICDAGATVVNVQQQPIQPLQGEIEAEWPGEQTVARALAGFDGLMRQEVPQHRRCAYYCTPEALTPALREAVRQLGCELTYAENNCLDILPRGVSRGATLQRAVQQLGIDPEAVLVVGDTGDDRTLFEQGYKGVCVAPSAPTLLEAAGRGSRVLRSQREGCGAILEALVHFGFFGETAIDELAQDKVWEGRSELVLVYHRLPYEEFLENGVLKRRRHKSPNGIIPTLMSFFASGVEGSWVAWSVHADAGRFDPRTAVDAERYPKLTAARVPLTQQEVDIFYKTFSKEAFWPTLHTFWERAIFREDHWAVFCAVNRKFAEAAAREAAPGAIVWLHDYNLWMVPGYLRELRPDVKIAFFHHTHFPSADVFDVIPWRRQIVASLLQCDYVGFHIPRQVENFVDVVRGTAPAERLETVSCAPRFLTYGCAVGLDQMTTAMRVGERIVRLGAHPVGLDVDRIREILARDAVRKQVAALRDNFKHLKLILSVERLDYTKGTLEKLLAYERLLHEHPELHGKVTMITVCVPAAKEMRIYDALQTQIEQAVGRINGQFSLVGWTPLQFFFRSFPFEEVVAYYAAADIMWITTLRDGLNLVASEFVATQGVQGESGVLVLSEFCGAAAVLKGALLTNPYDPKDMPNTIHQAIVMERAEADARLRGLFEIVDHYDLEHWGREFLGAVRDA